MFATAAVLDAKSKDDRRKHWDQAIADVKAGLDSFKDGDFSSTIEAAASKDDRSHAASHEVDESAVQSVFGAIGRIANSSVPACAVENVVNWKPVVRSQETQLDTHLRILDAHLRNCPTAEKLEYMDGEDPPSPAAEIDTESAPQSCALLKGREPKKAEHLFHMERMVAKLVTRLLLITKRFALDNESLAVVPTRSPINSLNQEFNDIAHRMVSLQAYPTGLPAYSMLTSESQMDRKELNDSIAAMISTKMLDQGSIDLMVTKLCYNLLISSSPPNVHTYTTMIVHFTRLKQHHLAQAVVESFFEHSRFAPNPWTVSAILDHYAAIGDGAGFRSVIQRMRGVDGDMRVKRRHLSVMGEPAIQYLALKSKVIHRNGNLHWKLPRNELIFQSLIRGSLKLFGVRRAVLYFKAAIREGWQLTSDLFIEIARACLAERNKKASVALLSALISQWQTREALALEDDATARSFIHQLMHFCGIDHLTSTEGYEKISFGFARLDLTGWLYNIRLKDINEKITRSAETISRLDMILTTSSSAGDDDPQRLISNMLDYLRWKSRKARRSLLAGRDTALAGSAARLADIEEELIATLCGSLSPRSQMAHSTRVAQLPYSMNFSERLKIALNLRRTRLPIMPEAQSHALATRSQTKLRTQDPSLITQSPITSQNSAVLAREASLPAGSEGPERDESNPKPVVRPESFPRPQFNVPSSLPEAVPTGYAVLRYSDFGDAENRHLRAAAE